MARKQSRFFGNRDEPADDAFDEGQAEHASPLRDGEDGPDSAVPPQQAGSAGGDAELAAALAAANDRVLRLQAEMQNLRDRTSREVADVRRYAALPVIRDLLPVVDNIDRAIEAARAAGEADNLLEGFRLVRQQLATLLAQHECTPIEADGQPFDPDYHAAILQQPSPNVPAGSVMMVTQTGYKLHDRVVRPAQVIVSSGPPAEILADEPADDG